MSRPAGRPTIYTEEIAREILDRMSAGETLRAICKDEHLPCRTTVSAWAVDDRPPGFADRYARARQYQADAMAEEALDLSDECKDPIKARLQVDTRKWLTSKINPAKFGDRHAVEVSGRDGVGAIRVELVDARGTDPVAG